MIKVLIVDDSALARKLLNAIFQRESDITVQFARNGFEALEELRRFRPDVITLDINMPRMDGLACLDRIMVEQPCPVVMVSSLTVEGAEATLQALRMGAVDFVSKPQGAVSLHIEELGRELVAKVRAAAGAKLRSSSRLKERVRLYLDTQPKPQAANVPAPARPAKAAAPLAAASPDLPLRRAIGDGLVLVGTSTGGPSALEALVTALPAKFPWPILIAQHMPASFTAALARRLDGLSRIHVVEVTEPVFLKPGYAYVGHGEADIVVARRGGDLIAMAVPVLPDYPWHPSVDRLVRSAMSQVTATQLIGILMTGMGKDGAVAMAELHASGGRTIAESEQSAVVWGMPGELVKAGGADIVVPLQEISRSLLKLTP